MTLPIAIVDRWPGDEYRAQHPSIEAALKHNVADALKVYREIESLKLQITGGKSKPEKLSDKKIDLLIREKDELLGRLIKFSDYTALTMAAYPDSVFMSSYDYKRAMDDIQDPILIRGIKTGDYAKHAQEQGRDYYFIETGYLGNYPSKLNRHGRKLYHRIEKNAMQQSRIMDVPDDRWQALCKFNPGLEYKGWRNNGSKILLVLSTEKPFEFYGHDRDKWVSKTIRTLKKHTDREIVVREKVGRSERTSDTIYEALDQDIWALVTYNSIAAVEAVQSGIPAFSMAPTAASAVSTDDLSKIEQPFKPSEDVIYKWLSSVAYGQFHLHEILTGEAWKMVQENECRSTFSY